MRIATFLAPSEDVGSRRRRAASLTLVVVVHLLLLLLLLRLAPPFEERLPAPALRIIPIAPETVNELKTHSAKASAKHAAGGAHPHVTAQPKAPAAATAQHAPAAPWVLNPALAGFDLAQVPTNPDSGKLAAADSGGSGSGTGTASGAGDSAGAGTGPGGEKLYVAEWYREPTDAELSTYMPKGRHVVGWGEVACKTIERFHVDDCKELGQSPPGSGISRAVREAAWQFLVRPPRVGGKLMIGEWVRIRITYSEAPASAP